LVALTEDFFTEDKLNQPARDVFCEFIALMIGHFLEKLSTFMFLIKEAHRMAFDKEAENATYLLRQRERVASALAIPIQAAIDNRQLRDLDAHTVAHVLMGNVHGYMMYACTAKCNSSGTSVSPQDGAALITTILFDGLLANRT
ncbi:MAG: hypothetical protein R3284_10320, partial [Rubricoccaceae bacterium]|nr:hypothetical protein [Rubricoccaceae bacterium]